MRARIHEAIGHRQVRLMTDLAQQNPGAALKNLRTVDDSPDHERYLARMERQRDWEKLGLTEREELFCLNLLELGGQNAVEAVKRVGLFEAKTKGSIANLASRLMKKRIIKIRMQQLLRAETGKLEKKRRFKVNGRRILEEIATIAYAKPKQRPTVAEKLEANRELATLTGMRPQTPQTVGGISVAQGVILELPNNGRDPQFALTNGQHASQPGLATPTAIIDFPPRDDEDDPGSNGHHPGRHHRTRPRPLSPPRPASAEGTAGRVSADGCRHRDLWRRRWRRQDLRPAPRTAASHHACARLRRCDLSSSVGSSSDRGWNLA
jgi:hypothetical protein